MVHHGCLQIPTGGKKGHGFKAGPLLACGVLALLILGAMLGLRITNGIRHSRTGSADQKQQAEEGRCVTVTRLHRLPKPFIGVLVPREFCEDCNP